MFLSSGEAAGSSEEVASSIPFLDLFFNRDVDRRSVDNFPGSSLGSEFLGKRRKRVSEFLGKRAPGSEFLGKRAPGNNRYICAKLCNFLHFCSPSFF